MSWAADFMMFCQRYGLVPDSSNRTSLRYWRDGRVPQPIRVNDGRDLTWEDIDELTGGRIVTLSCACPYCEASKTLQVKRITLAFARWRCFYCNKSGEVESGAVIDPADERAARREARERDKREREVNKADAIRLWGEAGRLAGTLGEVYLKARRLTILPDNIDDVLRWHPRCRFDREGPARCIVALFRDAITDEPTGIHRTKIISASGGIADRRALGGVIGSAIKLWPLVGDALVVGEGIETVLAAVALGEAVPPAWAATVAGNMTSLPVIPGVRRLTLLADNDSDKKKTGEKAARAARRSWLVAGREVGIKMPTAGADFNDLLIRRQS
jgi:hypothetical protein